MSISTIYSATILYLTSFNLDQYSVIKQRTRNKIAALWINTPAFPYTLQLLFPDTFHQFQPLTLRNIPDFLLKAGVTRVANASVLFVFLAERPSRRVYASVTICVTIGS
ncbi:hypothetical protein ACLB1E_37030 [Escherichia coli]